VNDTTSPIRILHLLPHYGGNYPLFINLVTGLDPARFESIICYVLRQSDEPNRLAEMGFPVSYLFEGGEALRPADRAVVSRLRRFLRDTRFDLVHSQRHNCTVQFLLATIGRSRPPILFHVHSSGRYRRFRRKLAGAWLARRISRFVAVSDSIRDDILSSLRGAPRARVVTVRNGIDPAPFTSLELSRREARAAFGLPTERLVIGAVGRLDPMKAHCDLIEAFRRFLPQCPGAVLAIAGEGRLRPRLEDQIASLELTGKVLLLGRRRDIPAFLRAIDLFALSSTGEGLPLALLEAMASGLPVASTRAFGVAETVEGLEGALVTEPRDTAALAESFRRIAALSPDERFRLGALNRRRVLESFTCERMVRDMERVYDSVLNERGGL